MLPTRREVSQASRFYKVMCHRRSLSSLVLFFFLAGGFQCQDGVPDICGCSLVMFAICASMLLGFSLPSKLLANCFIVFNHWHI